MQPSRPFRGNIVMLNGASEFCMDKKGKLTVFKASLYDINKAIEPKDFKERPLEQIVPELYYQLLPLFSTLLVDRLRPHPSGIDHEVRLKNGETPTWGPLYSISRTELVVLKEWLEEDFSKGFIRQSSAPFAALLLFAKKPGGGLRFCIDYCNMNTKPIMYQYPMLYGGVRSSI
jgi:hypothetical protein